uniref:Uncharacterized protein n=1 Tax=Caenorhabditis tropicalis TaxID=1561998 RepID=A0A1I7UH81_9PELO
MLCEEEEEEEEKEKEEEEELKKGSSRRRRDMKKKLRLFPYVRIEGHALFDLVLTDGYSRQRLIWLLVKVVGESESKSTPESTVDQKLLL